MYKFHLLYAAMLLLSFMFSSCEKDKFPFEGDVSINLGSEFLSLDSQKRTGTIDVMAKSPWQIEGIEPWLTLSTTAGGVGVSKIEVSLEANDSKARFTTLKFISGKTTTEFVVSQSAANVGFDDADYYFSATFGTLPSLYASLYLLKYNKPSYMFCEREGMFDPSKLPANITHVPYYAEGQDKMRDYMKENILKINRQDPTAVFGVLVDDLRARIGYDWFVAQGIDSSRVKVSMITDGTATYNEFYNRFSTEPQATDNWNNIVSEVEKLNWNHSDKYPASKVLPEFDSWAWAYYMSTLPNHRLILAKQKGLFETSSDYIVEQMKGMKAANIAPYELLQGLTSESKTRFFELTKFDHAHFEELFAQSAKPNLIIIGSVGQDEPQKSYTQMIYNQYSQSHDIFFKPHPRDASTAEYPDIFPELTLLPGQMPFEIFVWSLIDKIDFVGGFQSTVFLTVPIEKVGFIFAPNAQSLPKPLNIIFKDAQNVEWIQ